MDIKLYRIFDKSCNVPIYVGDWTYNKKSSK